MKQLYQRRVRDLGVAALAVAVVVACALVAGGGEVGFLERAVFRAINELPEFLRPVPFAFQLLGVLVVPLIAAVVALAFKRWRLAIALALVAPLKLFVEKGIIKELVDRQRPGTTIPDAILRDVSSRGPAFPSGHAIIAFALATILSPYLSPRWRIVAYVLALLVCIGRIYLGAHAPLDAVAGGAAGVAIGGILNYLVGVPSAVRNRRGPVLIVGRRTPETAP
ncbi:MAG: phosphatase PAP2 family protein [Actinomycetota bacterium]